MKTALRTLCIIAIVTMMEVTAVMAGENETAAAESAPVSGKDVCETGYRQGYTTPFVVAQVQVAQSRLSKCLTCCAQHQLDCLKD